MIEGGDVVALLPGAFGIVKHHVRENMWRTGVDDAVGTADFPSTVTKSVEEFQRRHGGRAASPASETGQVSGSDGAPAR